MCLASKGSVRTQNTVEKARVQWGKTTRKGAKRGEQEPQKRLMWGESGETFHLFFGRVLSSDRTPPFSLPVSQSDFPRWNRAQGIP